MQSPSPTRRFEFRFAPAYRRIGMLFGLTDRTTEVLLDEVSLRVRFGPWNLLTDLHNIRDTAITGPYGFLKTAGPAHLSLADRGITMATNGDRGVCMTFTDPVPGIEPTGLLRHPNLTVTVADCEGLVQALSGRSGQLD
jgi:hypothetical protein